MNNEFCLYMVIRIKKTKHMEINCRRLKYFLDKVTVKCVINSTNDIDFSVIARTLNPNCD